jgi:predicted transcriptional regulator
MTQTAMYPREMTAERALTEWQTLASQTAQIAAAEAEAIDPATGRLVNGRAVECAYQARHVTVMHLLHFGVPASVITSVTGLG